MTKYFLARTTKGKEFAFATAEMIAVPASTAQAIAEALTKAKYMLRNENEIWYVYENDWYYNDLINKEIKSYSPRRNIKIHSYWH